MNLEMHMQPQKTPRNSDSLRSGFRDPAELDELLDLVSSARSRRESPAATLTPVSAPVVAPEPEPAPVPKSLNDIFSNYVKYEKDIRALTVAQGTSQKLLFGPDWSTMALLRKSGSTSVELAGLVA
jgi:hypothetical protein